MLRIWGLQRCMLRRLNLVQMDDILQCAQSLIMSFTQLINLLIKASAQE